MDLQVSHTVWLNDAGTCSLEDLAQASGLSLDELRDLAECGVLDPVEGGRYRLHCVVTVRTARRLRDDFELDRHGLALALTLMRRIDALESRLRDVGL